MAGESLKGLRQATSFRRKEEAEGESSTKIPKSAVLYLHKPGTQYQCKDCAMFIADTERCSIHGEDDIIKPYGTCGLFVKGAPMPDLHPMGNVNKAESGYTDESRAGYSCKRCEYFLASAHDCRKVNKNSEGDDSHEIHPDGCCNRWEVLD